MNKYYLRKTVTTIFTCMLVVSSASADLSSLTIGTNPSGSTFYLLGNGIAKLYQTELGIRSTAQPNGGSSVYLPMISANDMTLGIAGSVDAGMAYNGAGTFPIEMTNLRVLARIWQLPYGYVTTGESGITRMEDLKGKRVMADMPTNVALTAINKAMLSSGGLAEDDVDFARSGGLINGIEAVLQGRADAAPVATTMPILMESHSSTPGGLRIIANGELASPEFYSELVPGITTMEVKPTTRHPYIVGDTEIVTYDVYLIANSNLSDDDAYLLTEALYQNWSQMQKDYGPLRSVPQNGLYIENSTLPYHPGAARFYRKAGF